MPFPLRVMALMLAASGTLSAALQAHDPDDPRPALLRQLTSTTVVELPERRRTLDQALEELRMAGNTVLLHLGINEQDAASLPPTEGPWWDAVLATCAAFELEPAPALVAHVDPREAYRQLGALTGPGYGGRSDRLSIGGGPLLLRPSRGAATQHRACGPVLVTISDASVVDLHRASGRDQWLEFSYAVRLEPRHPRELVGEAQVVWERAEADDGTALTLVEPGEIVDPLAGAILEEAGGRRGADRVRFAGLPADARRVSVAGTLRLTGRQVLTRRATLTDDGRPVALDLDGTTFVLRLYGDAAEGQLGGRPLANTLVVENPTGLMHQPAEVMLIGPGGRLLDVGHHSLTDDGQLQRTIIRFDEVINAACECRLAAGIELGTAHVPLACVIEVP